MKLTIPSFLILMFIGCAGQQTPKGGGGTTGSSDEIEELEQNTPKVELGAEVASHSILICSKDGSKDIVYVAKTYNSPQSCKHSKATGKNCVCELTSESQSKNNGVFGFATRDVSWCENSALDQILNTNGLTVYGTRGGVEITEFVPAIHDSSYTCARA